MKDTIEVPKKDYEALVKSVGRIELALLGDTEMKVEGLVQKVDRHGKYIRNDKRLKWIGAGAITGANVGFLAWIKAHLGL